MERTEIYKEAMRLVTSNRQKFTCLAIRDVERLWLSGMSNNVGKYRAVMGPPDNEIPPFEESLAMDGFTRAINAACPSAAERKRFRLMLLAMMDAVQEDF